MQTPPSAVIVGSGPAGLFAAERLAVAGWRVSIVERMPSPARKFLMAGRGGLNLTHAEAIDAFVGRYGEAADWIGPMVRAFPPSALVDWAEGLGQATFVGASGRVFPKAMKASPLLRAWLARLGGLGVELRLRTAWRGWSEDGAVLLQAEGGAIEALRPDATVLALGGASWPRLGSDGGWREILDRTGVALAPMRPANCGFEAGWSPSFRDRFAGQPLKAVAVTHAGRTVRGEAMVSAYGLEGGAVYALSAQIRDALAIEGPQTVSLDLRPDMTRAAVSARLARPPAGPSRSTWLRKALKLSPVAVNLIREALGPDLPADRLAAAVKAVPVTLTAPRPLERAISTAGGVRREAVDAGLQLTARPGVWVVGEMLDWEAPTGGYLLQGAFATAACATDAILAARA